MTQEERIVQLEQENAELRAQLAEAYQQMTHSLFASPNHDIPPAPSVPTRPNDRHSSGRPVLGERDHSFFLPKRNIQVCPLCLDEDGGYDRLYWRCDLLLFCLRHRVFLVSRCPAC